MTALTIDLDLPLSSNVAEVPDTREEVRSRKDLADGTIAKHTNINDAMPTTAVARGRWTRI